MKKITLSLFALFAGFAVSAQSISGNPDEITPGSNAGQPFERGSGILLTQSTNPSLVEDGGVACWSSPATGGDGTYRNNSFWRAYDLATFGVTGDFNITSVEYGQGTADDDKLINLNIYTVDTDDLSAATLTFVGSTTHTSSSLDDATMVSEALALSIPAGSIIAFEVNAPDSGANIEETYFPGINFAGETDDSYLQAADCGFGTPTTATDVGFPDNQYVMNVVGDEVAGLNDNDLSGIAVYPNPANDVVNIKAPAGVDIQSVSIFDVLGKETRANVVNGQINVSNLSRGVYILNINTNRGTLTQKVVKR